MKPLFKIFLLFLAVATIAGCSRNNHIQEMSEEEAAALKAESLSNFDIPIPVASGVNVERCDRVTIDYSNTHDGYVIILHDNIVASELRVVVKAPHDETYIYILRDGGTAEVIPLAEGNGEYTISVFEHVEGDQYKQLNSITIDVTLAEDHAPFIRPSQFVNYNRDSHLVALAYDLTRDSENTDEKITAIYAFVVDNFVYDYELAESVPSGYLPNLDNVLDRRKGICFDYASLVTAMLRSQGIPAMLEIGYHGEEYHAWISVYCPENGWIENRFNHNGIDWAMRDPTVESGQKRAHATRQEALNDEEYRVRYNY